MTKSKSMGSALLITGTAIGAGMLGIPLATSSLGVWPTLGLLVIVWLFSLLAGRLILAVILALPKHDLHYNRMAFLTLGRPGQWVAWVCVLGLLYSLTVAYITGGSSLFRSVLVAKGHTPPPFVLECLFTVVLGSFIVISTRATDALNRMLMGVKATLLVLMLFLCLPEVEHDLLKPTSHIPALGLGLLTAVPVLFVSFGFHHILPSLAQYNHYDVKPLQRALFWGSVIPLLVYIAWVIMTLGVIPLTGPDSFASLTSPDVGPFITLWVGRLQQPSLDVIIQLLAPIALITSFLGVTLGLFDFLSDSLSSRPALSKRRWVLGLMTFGLPLIGALLYPHGFIALLKFGGVFLAVMAFILPPLMAMKLNVGGKIVPIMVICFGILVAALGLFS
ncbi:MAG: amino acid permease [Gammaproteobacteria bacterium]